MQKVIGLDSTPSFCANLGANQENGLTRNQIFSLKIYTTESYFGWGRGLARQLFQKPHAVTKEVG